MDELRNAYADLRRTQQGLAQSEKLSSLGRFASGIAHEIKNPLGIILEGVELLETKLSKADKDVKITINKIKESTLRADTIVHGLLEFARPAELKTERIKLDDLVKEALSLHKYISPLRNIKIETHLAKEKLFIEVDKNQMQQVFLNLLLNAIEAMPQGGKINIRTYKMAKPELALNNSPCAIEVTDTGEGISKQNLRKIFEPFFTTKRERKGIGLGLSIVKMIIDNHKGNLEIDSILGKGTTARIILPLVWEDVQDNEKKNPYHR